MKILNIISSAALEGGGPIEGVLRMSELIRARGHDHQLFTLDPPDAPFLQDLPLEIHALGARYAGPPKTVIGRKWRYFNYSPEAVRWAKRHVPEYDAVIVNGVWNYATHVARRALPGSGVPYVVYSHGMLDPWFRQTYPIKDVAKRLLWPWNEGVLYRHAAAVAFTCQIERELAHNNYRPWHVRERVVAYGTSAPPAANPQQEAAFRVAVPMLGDRPFLLFLSRIHKKKGCDLLIEAFGRIAPEHPELDLVIAGPDQVGLMAQFQARAAEMGIADRIYWPGMLRGDAKWGAFRCCEAFILPSHQENFGIVVAEALACGKPALISDQVNIYREITDARAGLVAPDTVEGFEALLRDFVALDHAERRAMGKRGIALFERQFTIEAAVDDLLGLLHEAVAEKHRMVK